MVEILQKLGIRPKRWTTEELKKIYLETKVGEKTPEGNIVTERGVEFLRKMPAHNESRIKQYIEVAFKECIEDIRYNTSRVSTECICKKIRDEKFRDAVRRPEHYIPEEAILKFPKKE